MIRAPKCKRCALTRSDNGGRCTDRKRHVDSAYVVTAAREVVTHAMRNRRRFRRSR